MERSLWGCWLGSEDTGTFLSPLLPEEHRSAGGIKMSPTSGDSERKNQLEQQCFP